jgi:hypothetical protein
MAEVLTEDRRREVFAALVAAQDGGLDVTASRKKVAADHGLTPKRVERIEREGLDAEWPPLGDAPPAAPAGTGTEAGVSQPDD